VRHWLIKVLTLTLLAAGASGTALAQSAVDEDVYLLGAGDELRITVFNHADLSGEFSVDGNGMISFPLIGEISVQGHSAKQLEMDIEGALKPDYLLNPSVTIEVINYRPFYILGEVRAPGAYNFVSGMRVINAVVLAGGYTYRAKQNKVYIDRGGDESARIAAGPDTMVMPGDIVRIPERFF
jgi:protein involved in polysaccharide export with SLBB domain